MIDIKIKNRIEWFSKNKINDFSPTISPAPKNKENKEIESIKEAVDYFLKNNVNQLVIQKKYMGSYCTIYLKKNLEQTYFVSRNGHKIEHIDLEQSKKSLEKLHKKLIEIYSDFDTIIIASELLPWKVMGGGLIEKEFLGYYDALKTNHSYLKESNLLEKINQVKNSEPFLEYAKDKKNLSNKEFKNKHKAHIIRQYDALSNVENPNLDMQEKSLSIFKEQIDAFGKEETIYFKPFNILKIVLENGKEEIPNSNLTYQIVNEDAFLNLKFDENNYEENIKIIYNFFEKVSNNNEEGIMIKSEKSYIKNLPPCFKIRNNKYLTMIYGINFYSSFDYYLAKRSISKKIQQSINGWEINQQMLQIPYKNLNEENYLMKLLLLKRINDEEIEKTLDPRL